MNAGATLTRDLPLAWVERTPLDGPAWLTERRRAAAGRFAEHGFPSRREESWRFTPVDAIADTAFAPPPAAEGIVATPAGGAIRLVDGALRELPARLPAGVEAVSLASALRAGAELLRPHLVAVAEAADEVRRPFLDLNTALFTGGLFLRVCEGAPDPIAVTIESTARAVPSASHPRLLVVLEPHTELTLVERYRGEGTYLCNAVTEVVLGDGAVLRHVRVEEDSEHAFHVATVAIRQGRDSSYRGHAFSFGGSLARIDLDVALAGEGAEAVLDGLYVAAGRQHLDHHTFVDHRVPHGTSLQRYKGIVDGQARAVFDGRVTVRRDAQKTSAHQENRNLLLSRQALAHTKPSLTIDADDVKCSHGATVGQLDEEPLFYLRSRGIGEAEARRMLTDAFAREVLDRLPLPGLRAELALRALSRISYAGGKS